MSDDHAAPPARAPASRAPTPLSSAPTPLSSAPAPLSSAPAPLSRAAAPLSRAAAPLTGQTKMNAVAGAPTAGRFRRLADAAKRRITLRIALSASVTSIIGAVSACMLVFGYQTLRFDKTTDVWALLFLDMEAAAHRVVDAFVPALAPEQALLPPELRPPSAVKPLARYELTGRGELRRLDGDDLKLATLADLGVTDPGDLKRWNSLDVAQDRARRYVVLRSRLPSQRLILSFLPHPTGLSLGAQTAAEEHTLVYVLTRQGRLLFSSNGAVTGKNVQSRKLVQTFVRLPVAQGQLELDDPATKERSFGYFMELGGTNLVLFAETPAEIVEHSVSAVMRRLAMVAGVTVFFGLLLTQIFVLVMLRPLRVLGEAAGRIGQGDLSVAIAPMSFGEVRALSTAFGDMARGLAQRDRAIAALIAEQREKARLESELAIASTIQGNLLPRAGAATLKGLALASVYQPAAEVAGDWYGAFADEGSRSQVAAIVDVSGHGVGASIFTAMAAAVFEELRDRFARDRDVRFFFESFNRQLARYGANAWSATAQVAVIDLARETATVLNAGHLEPVYDDGRKDAKLARLKGLASSPLGFGHELQIATVTVPFAKGARLFLYTDGLTERREPTRNVFGAKRLVAAVQSERRAVDEGVLRGVISATDRFAHNTPRADDICLVGLQNTAA
jgi:serine phosphatase RsbU (regulator of sigma subunit)